MGRKKGSNATSVKQNNRALILQTIRQNGNLSRADLSKITGLTKGGITPIIQDMLALALIKESGISDTSAGRKPILLELNDSVCYVITVDWNRKGYSIALVNFKGKIHSTSEYEYNNDTLDTILERIKISISQMLYLEKGKKIIGIIVVAPGPLDCISGVIFSPPHFRGWSNIYIKDLLEKEFDIPVFLDNDASAYAVAEKYYGKGKSYHNFIHIAVNEGIGAGIVIDDKVFRGKKGFGGEIGHITIDVNGPRCDCGNIGCLEIYASTTAIINRINKHIKEGQSSYLSNRKHIKWKDVIEALNENDVLCIKEIEEEAVYLGSGMVTIINLFEPEAVIIGGKLGKVGKFIISPLKKFIERKVINRNMYLPELLITDLHRASLIGGASIVFTNFIKGGMGEYEDLLKK